LKPKSTKDLKGKRVNGVLYLAGIDPIPTPSKRRGSKGAYYSIRKNLKRT
jgi:hypothetical protein